MEGKFKQIKINDEDYKLNKERHDELKQNQKTNTIISFYLNLLITNANIYNFRDFPYLHQKLIHLNKNYQVKQIGGTNIKIEYRRNIIDTSEKNILFSSFMKFHVGFLQFLEWFNKFRLDQISLDEDVIHDYTFKQLYVCLENSRRNLGQLTLNELSDIELVSKICRKERLMLYNYLLINSTTEKKHIKDFIHHEYLRILKEKKDISAIKKGMKNLSFDHYFELYRI